MGLQCSHLLKRSDIINSLKNKNFDLIIIELFDYCPVLVTEKLRKLFVVILHTFSSAELRLPSSVSYIPALNFFLIDQMHFQGKVKNFLMFSDFFQAQWKVHSLFDNTIKEHFSRKPQASFDSCSKESRIVCCFFFNSDLAFEFSWLLVPNTVYIGGILVKAVKPVPPVSKILALSKDI